MRSSLTSFFRQDKQQGKKITGQYPDVHEYRNSQQKNPQMEFNSPQLEHSSWLMCHIDITLYVQMGSSRKENDPFCSSNRKHLSVENYEAKEAQK